MACDTGCCADKDVKACPVCGGSLPASLGVKPRKYCSKPCLRQATRPRNPGAEKCADCKNPLRQPPGKGRKRVICPACRIARKRKRDCVASCRRCGREFAADRDDAAFCSTGCRWPSRLLESQKTCDCGVTFTKRTKYCSIACSIRHCKRNDRRKVYRCIHCYGLFGSRAYQTANKYCSRKCAFEARRLRCVGIASDSLSAWFHTWGDESHGAFLPRPARTSHKARCEKFGVPYEAVDRSAVLKRAGWVCYLCGRALLKRYTKDGSGRVSPASPTIDCVVPLSAGPGSPGYVYENVRACCLACNLAKSDQHPDSFVPQYPTSLD